MATQVIWSDPDYQSHQGFMLFWEEGNLILRYKRKDWEKAKEFLLTRSLWEFHLKELQSARQSILIDLPDYKVSLPKETPKSFSRFIFIKWNSVRTVEIIFELGDYQKTCTIKMADLIPPPPTRAELEIRRFQEV